MANYAKERRAHPNRDDWPEKVADLYDPYGEPSYAVMLREVETRGGTILDVGEIVQIVGWYKGLKLDTVHRCQYCYRRSRQGVVRLELAAARPARPEEILAAGIDIEEDPTVEDDLRDAEELAERAIAQEVVYL